MIRVRAAARLHFGLLSLRGPGDDFGPNRNGEPALPGASSAGWG